MKRVYFALALVGALIVPSAARANITFQYVAGTPTTGSPGSTSTVSIYLQETDTNGTTFFGQPTIMGLASFGIYVHQTSGGGSTISSFNTTGTSFNEFGTSQSFPVPASPPGGTANSSTSASMPTNSIDYFNSVPAGTLTNPATLVSGSAGNGVYQILVGTLNVTIGTSTTFTLTSMFNSPGDNSDAGSDVTFSLPAAGSHQLDQSGTFGSPINSSFVGASSGTTTFTVSPLTTTPEPSSMLLCGLAGVGMGVGAWRRRKAKLAITTETTAVEA